MPLLYDWYETPQSHDKPQEEKVYHPRVCLRQRRTTEHLCNLIEKMTTASRADIKLVLAALSDVLGMELCAGNQVHLDGLGYFNISLAAIEPVYATTKNKAYMYRLLEKAGGTSASLCKAKKTLSEKDKEIAALQAKTAL